MVANTTKSQDSQANRNHTHLQGAAHQEPIGEGKGSNLLPDNSLEVLRNSLNTCHHAVLQNHKGIDPWMIESVDTLYSETKEVLVHS